jgi:nitroimidazol reductase NimA-like FMN-containing flavoprotein (pyridoxamine 5'-phosphate oxidase superfamily)
MVIREMSSEECRRVLAGARLARLGCAHSDQPYVVPVYLVYYEPTADESCFYGYSTFGQKVKWMRANPRVCVEMDEVKSPTQWKSVVTFGRFEELPEVQELNVGPPPARHEAADHSSLIYPAR